MNQRPTYEPTRPPLALRDSMAWVLFEALGVMTWVALSCAVSIVILTLAALAARKALEG